MRRLLGDNEVDPVMDVYKKFINHTDPTQIPILLTNPSIESLSRKVPYGVGVRQEDIYVENGEDIVKPLNDMIKTFKEDASVTVKVATSTETVTGVQQAGNQPGAYAFNGMNIYTVIDGGNKDDTSLVFAGKVSDDKTTQEIDYPYIIFPESCEQSIDLIRYEGEKQYMFVSSDRFVMTVQQPGDVYLDQRTKVITCCIYPKVHRLVDKLYFQPAPLDQRPNYLKCYSFAIDWGK